MVKELTILTQRHVPKLYFHLPLLLPVSLQLPFPPEPPLFCLSSEKAHSYFSQLGVPGVLPSSRYLSVSLSRARTQAGSTGTHACRRIHRGRALCCRFALRVEVGCALGPHCCQSLGLPEETPSSLPARLAGQCQLLRQAGSSSLTRWGCGLKGSRRVHGGQAGPPLLSPSSLCCRFLLCGHGFRRPRAFVPLQPRSTILSPKFCG